MASETEINVVLKDGPQYQIPAPQEYVRTDRHGKVLQKTSRAQAHMGLVREATGKAREGFDPRKVAPCLGYVWGKIIDVWKTDVIETSLARPDNAKASVRHWIETLEGRRLIFEYAHGELIRTAHDGEWLMIKEKHVLAEEIGPEIVVLNRSILLKVEPLPDHTGVLYDPSARQVQAEVGQIRAMDCEPELGLKELNRIAFIATAGTYCIIAGEEYRLIHRDQAMAVIEEQP